MNAGPLKEQPVFLSTKIFPPALVAYIFKLSTQEAEAADFCEFQHQPGLQSKLQDSQGYTEKSCLQKTKPNQKLIQEQGAITMFNAINRLV